MALTLTLSRDTGRGDQTHREKSAGTVDHPLIKSQTKCYEVEVVARGRTAETFPLSEHAMNDADVPTYAALRQENAALCGARRVFRGEAIADKEPPAAQDVAHEAEGALSARQSRVAAMLATGMSVAEVAVVTGLHRGTIFRWRQSSPVFRTEQARCSAVAAGELAEAARRLIVKATGYVERLMEDDNRRDAWAARILRNQRLWNIAVPGGDRDESTSTIAPAREVTSVDVAAIPPAPAPPASPAPEPPATSGPRCMAPSAH